MNNPLLNSMVRLIEGDEGWFALLADDTLVEVDGWYDEDGDPCEPKDAFYCVAGADGLGWMTIELHAMLDKEILN